MSLLASPRSVRHDQAVVRRRPRRRACPPRRRGRPRPPEGGPRRRCGYRRRKPPSTRARPSAARRAAKGTPRSGSTTGAMARPRSATASTGVAPRRYGREAGCPPADDGEQDPGPDAERHQHDARGSRRPAQDQRLRHREDQSDQRRPAASSQRQMRETCGRPSPSSGGKAEGEQHREDRQHRQQVARVDRVAEGEDHDDHGAPEREQPDRRRPGTPAKVSAGRRGEPEEEERPAEEREDADEEVAGKGGEHPERSVGRIAGDLVAEELGGELRRISSSRRRRTRRATSASAATIGTGSEDRASLARSNTRDVGDQRRHEARPAGAPWSARRAPSRSSRARPSRSPAGSSRAARTLTKPSAAAVTNKVSGMSGIELVAARMNTGLAAIISSARIATPGLAPRRAGERVGEEEDAAGGEHPEQAEAGDADAEHLEPGGAEPVGDDWLLQPDLAVRRPRDQPVAGLDHPRPAIGVMALVRVVEDHVGADRHHHGEIGRGDDERRQRRRRDREPRAGRAPVPRGGRVCRRRRSGAVTAFMPAMRSGEPGAVGSGHCFSPSPSRLASGRWGMAARRQRSHKGRALMLSQPCRG